MRRVGLFALVIVGACTGGASGTAGPSSTSSVDSTTTASATVRATTTVRSTTTVAPTTPLTTTSTTASAQPRPTATTSSPVDDDRIPVILDTDANNELDDQHAIAYLLASSDVFDVLGLTINRTSNGGALDLHVAEAERIVALMGRSTDVPVVAGADGSFGDIDVNEPDFDGRHAVDFIIETVRAHAGQPVLLLPIGKLTNIALALERAPDIADDVRVLWLGSNYPDPGEYNQDNDESALRYVLDTDVQFEIALVRAGGSTGTASVLVSISEILDTMPGLGPAAAVPVVGRDGGEFTSFGDYSVDLFEHASLEGDSRALYDLAAIAIAREPNWATPIEIPAPQLEDGVWAERPDNDRTIVIWDRFDRDAIIASMFETLGVVSTG